MHTKSASRKVNPSNRQIVEDLLSEARIAADRVADATAKQRAAFDEIREQKARHERALKELGELALGQPLDA